MDILCNVGIVSRIFSALRVNDTRTQAAVEVTFLKGSRWVGGWVLCVRLESGSGRGAVEWSGGVLREITSVSAI